ncbi:hypothetical protein ACA910_018373 [Epithemia clementina (nom. ined.)]
MESSTRHSSSYKHHHNQSSSMLRSRSNPVSSRANPQPHQSSNNRGRETPQSQQRSYHHRAPVVVLTKERPPSATRSGSRTRERERDREHEREPPAPPRKKEGLQIIEPESLRRPMSIAGGSTRRSEFKHSGKGSTFGNIFSSQRKHERQYPHSHSQRRLDLDDRSVERDQERQKDFELPMTRNSSRAVSPSARSGRDQLYSSMKRTSTSPTPRGGGSHVAFTDGKRPVPASITVIKMEEVEEEGEAFWQGQPRAHCNKYRQRGQERSEQPYQQNNYEVTSQSQSSLKPESFTRNDGSNKTQFSNSAAQHSTVASSLGLSGGTRSRSLPKVDTHDENDYSHYYNHNNDALGDDEYNNNKNQQQQQQSEIKPEYPLQPKHSALFNAVLMEEEEQELEEAREQEQQSRDATQQREDERTSSDAPITKQLAVADAASNDGPLKPELSAGADKEGTPRRQLFGFGTTLRRSSASRTASNGNNNKNAPKRTAAYFLGLAAQQLVSDVAEFVDEQFLPAKDQDLTKVREQETREQATSPCMFGVPGKGGDDDAGFSGAIPLTCGNFGVSSSSRQPTV